MLASLQTQDVPRDPLSALPPQTGDPRATVRELDPVPPSLPSVAPLPDTVRSPAAPPPPAPTRPTVTSEPGLLPPVPQPRQPLQPGSGAADAAVDRLPQPTQDPLSIARDNDPILGLARNSVERGRFVALVGQAVARSPRVAEAEAGIDEAAAARGEAVARRYPVIDVGFNSQQSILRNFDDNDVDTIVERSRGQSRSDVTINAEQTLFDFGSTESRVRAAGARLRAAAHDAEAEADQVALRAIAAWYDVFAYRALVRLGEAFAGGQADLRAAINERIELGVSAPGDLPRVESYIASAQTELARFRRALANAEARFQEVYGEPAPADLGRAPVLQMPAMSKDSAALLARASPAVESSEALARAAAADARAQRTSTYPRLSAGIDAGRYGILEGDNYDVRGRVTLRQRLFGGVESRNQQFDARAAAAEARADTVRNEAEREAAIAWSDVQALEQQLAALEDSYVASRQSRDVLAERFRVARGTLFDLLESESSYFSVATVYIRGITELDAARYVLLSRTGQLLPTLDIAPPALEDQ